MHGRAINGRVSKVAKNCHFLNFSSFGGELQHSKYLSDYGLSIYLLTFNSETILDLLFAKNSWRNGKVFKGDQFLMRVSEFVALMLTIMI